MVMAIFVAIIITHVANKQALLKDDTRHEINETQ